jgi:hypothetical protein
MTKNRLNLLRLRIRCLELKQFSYRHLHGAPSEAHKAIPATPRVNPAIERLDCSRDQPGSRLYQGMARLLL